MTIQNPAPGNDSGLPGIDIPTEIVEQMMLDATTLHGLPDALDLCIGDANPAINALVSVTKPSAKNLADDLAKQW